MSKVLPMHLSLSITPLRKLITSLIAMGWLLVLSHFGVIITGSFSTRSRIISNDALPEPSMIPARRTVSGTLLL